MLNNCASVKLTALEGQTDCEYAASVDRRYCAALHGRGTFSKLAESATFPGERPLQTPPPPEGIVTQRGPPGRQQEEIQLVRRSAQGLSSLIGKKGAACKEEAADSRRRVVQSILLCVVRGAVEKEPTAPKKQRNESGYCRRQL